MTLDQLVDVANDQPQRWMIYEEKEQIFIGWIWELKDQVLEPREKELYQRIKDREVGQFKFHLDIKHKQWEEKKLMKPLMPDETPQYLFSDLRLDMYYEVHLKRKEQNDVKE